MRILIIGPSWVGDMMMSQSLYRTLKHKYPEAIIDVMAPAWSLPLIARMPEVNRGIEMPIGHGAIGLGVRYRLGKLLRQYEYTHAYVLPNSFKSALIPWFAKISNRIGWRGEYRYGLLTDCRTLNKPDFVKMVERYVALAYPAQKIRTAQDIPKPILVPQLKVSEKETFEVLNKFLSPENKHSLRQNKNQLFIGFSPGAEFGPAKRWPDYHYAKLAQTLIQQGHLVVLLGSAKDHAIAEDIRKQLSETQRASCLNLAGNTSLDEVICLISGLNALITNDSGLMHIAAAFNKPLVALYGPTSPQFTPPLSEQAIIIRLIEGFIKVRKTDQAMGYHQSLIDITPDSVMTQLQPMLHSMENTFDRMFTQYETLSSTDLTT